MSLNHPFNTIPQREQEEFAPTKKMKKILDFYLIVSSLISFAEVQGNLISFAEVQGNQRLLDASHLTRKLAGTETDSLQMDPEDPGSAIH